MHRATNESGSKGLTKKQLLLVALGGAVGLFALTTTTTPLFSTPSAPSASRSLRRRQLSHATPLERVGKVIEHALKPRFGKHKGKDIGGDWVHKAVGDSEGVSRPDLGMMRADELPPEPARANDSVLRLGGGLRNGPAVKAIQDRRNPQPPRKLQLIKARPPTFSVTPATPATPEQVVPVDQVNGNGGAKDNNEDKSVLLAGHGKGHKHGHEHDLDLDHLHKKGHGHDHDLDHLHKHGHGHKKKHVNPLVVAHLYTKKKAMQAAHKLEKAVLKAKGNKLHHELEKKGNEVHRDIAKAVHGHAAHIKKTKRQAEAKVAHVAHVAHAAGQAVHVAGHAAHAAHDVHDVLHRALQPGQNLSEEDKEKLRMIARDAALKVLKEAARDAGFDAALLAEAEEEAEAAAGAKAEDYEEEEVEEALANLLSLDDLLLLNKPATFFLDRAQVTNDTAANTTEAADAATDDTPLILGMLSALRDMNMTATEAERLRSEARTAAMQAIRDIAREAGIEDRIQGNTNLEALFNNIASAAGTGAEAATTGDAAAATTTTPTGNRQLHHEEYHEDEDEGDYNGHRQLAGRWSYDDDDDEKHAHEYEWDEAYFPERGARGHRSFEDYNKHGTHGSLGKRGHMSGYESADKHDRQLWNYYSGRKTEGWGGSDGEDEAFWEDDFFAEAQNRRQGKRGHHSH